jgi:hypothetical protein
MQAIWRRQWPRRIKYHPHEMKMVLMKFSDALIAGRSVIFKQGRTFNVQRPTSNVQFPKGDCRTKMTRAVAPTSSPLH